MIEIQFCQPAIEEYKYPQVQSVFVEWENDDPTLKTWEQFEEKYNLDMVDDDDAKVQYCGSEPRKHIRTYDYYPDLYFEIKGKGGPLAYPLKKFIDYLEEKMIIDNDYIINRIKADNKQYIPVGYDEKGELFWADNMEGGFPEVLMEEKFGINFIPSDLTSLILHGII